MTNLIECFTSKHKKNVIASMLMKNKSNRIKKNRRKNTMANNSRKNNR